MKYYGMIMLLSTQIAQASEYDNPYALPFPTLSQGKITKLRQQLTAQSDMVNTAYESMRSTFQAYQQLCATHKVITSKIGRNNETFNWIEYIRNNPELLLEDQLLQLAYTQELFIAYKILYKNIQPLIVPVAQAVGYHDAILRANNPKTTLAKTPIPKYVPIPFPPIPAALRSQSNHTAPKIIPRNPTRRDSLQPQQPSSKQEL